MAANSRHNGEDLFAAEVNDDGEAHDASGGVKRCWHLNPVGSGREAGVLRQWSIYKVNGAVEPNLHSRARDLMRGHLRCRAEHPEGSRVVLGDRRDAGITRGDL